MARNILRTYAKLGGSQGTEILNKCFLDFLLVHRFVVHFESALGEFLIVCELGMECCPAQVTKTVILVGGAAHFAAINLIQLPIPRFLKILACEQSMAGVGGFLMKMWNSKSGLGISLTDGPQSKRSAGYTQTRLPGLSKVHAEP